MERLRAHPFIKASLHAQISSMHKVIIAARLVIWAPLHWEG